MSDVHVIPLNDLREHETSECCWCKPIRDELEDGVIVHNAMDMREKHETGELKPN